MIMPVIIIMSSLILLQTWSLVDKITIITAQMNQCVLPNECLVPVLSGRAHLNRASFDNGIAQDHNELKFMDFILIFMSSLVYAKPNQFSSSPESEDPFLK